MNRPNLAFDTSDVDKWIGKQIVFAEMYAPCNATDIRRWVQAMDYANPLHWDEEFARNSQFGGLIAPQSFTVAMDYGHGCHPGCVGNIPGSHLIFAGDVTYVDGEVIEKIDKSPYGLPVVKVQTRMTTQTGETILKGTAEVSLPA